MDINSLFNRSSSGSSSSTNLAAFQKDMLAAQYQMTQQIARLNYQKQIDSANQAAILAAQQAQAARLAQATELRQKVQTVQDIVDVYKIQKDVSEYNVSQYKNSLFELNRVAEVNNKRITQDLRNSTGQVRVSFGATNIVADTGSARAMVDQLSKDANQSAADVFRQTSAQKQQVMANITNEFINNEYNRLAAAQQVSSITNKKIGGEFGAFKWQNGVAVPDVTVNTDSLKSPYEN